jgi:cytochrome P450
MSDTLVDIQDIARERAYSMPIEDINVANAELFRTDTFWPYFERLRREAPVHYCANHHEGAYWSVTKYNDIMHVDAHHEIFSSQPSITIVDPFLGMQAPMFIAMDPPKHTVQRKVVNPAVAGANLAAMEGLIRQRVGVVLDELPIGETFDWVDHVSIEVTTQMLATLFDFPWEDRRKLTWWSDVAVADPTSTEVVGSGVERVRAMSECLTYFVRMWNERVNAPPTGDLISMLAHGDATRTMNRIDYLGNILLLIVGGNDTTRNSITGGVLALNEFPSEYEKLRRDPSLIVSMVPEIIRWQTPLAYMRRTAAVDTELGGQSIKKGDKVVMWYISGNRDEEAIENPNAFIIDRERPRQHLSFGFGIHRCLGNRLAELQLRVVWEEILKRFDRVEVVGEPVRVASPFIRGYRELPVRLWPRVAGAA